MSMSISAGSDLIRGRLLLADAGGGKAGPPRGPHVPPSCGRVSPAAVPGAARGGVLPQERCSDRSAAAAGDVQGGGAAAYHGTRGGCCCGAVRVGGGWLANLDVVWVFSLVACDARFFRPVRSRSARSNQVRDYQLSCLASVVVPSYVLRSTVNVGNMQGTRIAAEVSAMTRSLFLASGAWCVVVAAVYVWLFGRAQVCLLNFLFNDAERYQQDALIVDGLLRPCVMAHTCILSFFLFVFGFV